MTALQITLSPARFDDGPNLERVAFGRLEIIAAGELLTTAIANYDGGRPAYRRGPYISGYHLAEWLVWNWWRLRWEPHPCPGRRPPFEWSMAHGLSDIGEGYHWPPVSIWSDGYRVSLTSDATAKSDSPSFYYLGVRDGRPATVPATDFETAVDGFVAFVLQRLRDENFADTNLHTIWNDLCLERSDPEIGRFRRVEALLGFDPDEKGDEYINNLLKGADILGAGALDELATGAAGSMLSAQEISDLSAVSGFAVNAGVGFHGNAPLPAQWGSVEAWQIGIAMADAVRCEAALPYPMDNSRLADLAGMSVKAIKSDVCTRNLSWVFNPLNGAARVALRTHLETGRRFDVARLIGDRLFAAGETSLAEPLAPATRSYSYRQKAQRTFAAQLLCPWEAMLDTLGSDFSDENLEQVADAFNVSSVVVKRQIENSERYSLAAYG